MSRTGPASYPRPVPTGPTTTRRSVNDVELDVIEAGDPAGPAIVLSHGFPECAHSWRHQIEPLAAAGYHVLAPDQRGYGRSSAPRDVQLALLNVYLNDPMFQALRFILRTHFLNK